MLNNLNTIILYDSTYGNTQQIAITIADNLNKSKIFSVDKIDLSDLKNINLLVVGSPTLGGRPTTKLQSFFNKIPANGLKNVKLAVFDTSLSKSDQNFALKLLMKIIGYAAPKIAVSLKTKGAKLIAPPQSFIVISKSGPLKAGETDHAKNWAKEISKI